MIRNAEAEIVRLIVTTREKFPHSVQWNEALKQVIWRYTGQGRRAGGKAKSKRRKARTPRA